MTRKFPKAVRLTIGRRQPLSPTPVGWEVHTRADSRFIAEGTAASRAEAREQAWLALEQCGLVVDE